MLAPPRPWTLNDVKPARRRSPGVLLAVYGGIAIVLGLQALFVYAPFMHTVFGSEALAAREIAWAAVASLLILPVTWAEERWRVARARV